MEEDEHLLSSIFSMNKTCQILLKGDFRNFSISNFQTSDKSLGALGVERECYTFILL